MSISQCNRRTISNKLLLLLLLLLLFNWKEKLKEKPYNLEKIKRTEIIALQIGRKVTPIHRDPSTCATRRCPLVSGIFKNSVQMVSTTMLVSGSTLSPIPAGPVEIPWAVYSKPIDDRLRAQHLLTC